MERLRRDKVNMKIKDLAPLIFDNIIIYKAKGEGYYENIYKGNTNSIPSNLLEMKIRAIGAARKGVVDIEVFKTEI